MYSCDQCTETFKTWQAKANHVRWNHKKSTYSDEGRQKLTENAHRINEKRYGRKIVESRECPKCSTNFEVTYREGKSTKAKKFCSRSCANSHVWTQKRRDNLSKTAKANGFGTIIKPNLKNNPRFSSKAERALAAALGEKFRRHHNVTLNSGRRIDVDIVHRELLVWIESDGIYHFEKVHEGHDFDKSLARDREEGEHCCDSNILLLRVRNDRYTIDEQVAFILSEINQWDGKGKVITLY